MERKERRLFFELQGPGFGGVHVPYTVNLNVSWDDPWDDLPKDVRYHTIKKDTPYRLWNLVSNGLIQPTNDKPSVVTCSGQFGDPYSKEVNYNILF